MKLFVYRIETEFGGKWHWLDSFETLTDALHVALKKRCKWRIRKHDTTLATSVY